MRQLLISEQPKCFTRKKIESEFTAWLGLKNIYLFLIVQTLNIDLKNGAIGKIKQEAGLFVGKVM